MEQFFINHNEADGEFTGFDDKILIESDGRFELISRDDIRADACATVLENSSVKNQASSTTSPESYPDLDISGKSVYSELYSADGSSVPSLSGGTSSSSLDPGQNHKAECSVENVRTSNQLLRTPFIDGNKKIVSTRPYSALGTKQSRVEPAFANITSLYAMSEHQKQLKQKHKIIVEERKQLEAKVAAELEKKKKEEAEKAYQAWLEKKRSRSRSVDCQKSDNGSGSASLPMDSARGFGASASLSADAFGAWLIRKQEQARIERHMQRLKIMEEASFFKTRDKSTCDHAFQSWIERKYCETKPADRLEKPVRSRLRNSWSLSSCV